MSFPDRRRWVQALLLVGFWTLVACIFILSELVLTWTGANEEPLTTHRALFTLLGWYTWIPSTLIVLALVRRFPLDRVRNLWGVAVHLLAAPMVSLFASVLFTGMRGVEFWWLGQSFENGAGAYLLGVFQRSVALDSVIYLTILLGIHAVAYYRQVRERELQAARLETSLAEAHLRALRLQLQPHFLFNTFHTIAMLVRDGRDDDAVDTIAALSDFLRYVLDQTGEQEVPLWQEINFLESYLDIEHIRFHDVLQVHIDVDPRAETALVPSFLLQPLVENAIRHGIEPAPSHRGSIEVTARRDGKHLALEVRDDGVGLPENWEMSDATGIGLANTRDRLQRLYGTDHEFTLTNARNGGLVATIRLPYSDVSVPDALPSSHRSLAGDSLPATAPPTPTP